MGKLLLIMGDLATGKSTFASILSKRYDTNAFFKDSIKEVLGDTIGFFDGFEDFKTYTENLRDEKIPGKTIYINADDFSYQTDKEILVKIDEFMGDAIVC